MALYTKHLLSQSMSGNPIAITATGSDTTLIHTTLASNITMDEIWLYATNYTGTDMTFKLIYGCPDNGCTLFNGVLEAYAGSTLICPGLVATGNGTNGFQVHGNASALSGINVFGYVNRIS